MESELPEYDFLLIRGILIRGILPVLRITELIYFILINYLN